MERAHGMQGLENHQREGALPDVLFVFVAHRVPSRTAPRRFFLWLRHRKIDGFLWESNRKVSWRPLVGLGGGSWDALAAAEFGFDVRDIAFGEVIEELPGAVFLPDLRQNGLAEAGAALALLLGRTDPFTQVGKIAAESGDIGVRAGVAVARDEDDGRFGRKLGQRRERFE